MNPPKVPIQTGLRTSSLRGIRLTVGAASEKKDATISQEVKG